MTLQRSDPFYFSPLFFPVRCEQSRPPVTTVVPNGCHVCLPQRQRQQRRLTSSLSVCLLRGECGLTKETRMINPAVLKTANGKVLKDQLCSLGSWSLKPEQFQLFGEEVKLFPILYKVVQPKVLFE